MYCVITNRPRFVSFSVVRPGEKPFARPVVSRPSPSEGLRIMEGTETLLAGSSYEKRGARRRGPARCIGFHLAARRYHVLLLFKREFANCSRYVMGENNRKFHETKENFSPRWSCSRKCCKSLAAPVTYNIFAGRF